MGNTIAWRWLFPEIVKFQCEKCLKIYKLKRGAHDDDYWFGIKVGLIQECPNCFDKRRNISFSSSC